MIKNILVLGILLLAFWVAKSQDKTENVPENDLIFLYETLVKEHPKLQLIKYKSAFDSVYNKTRIHFSELDRNEAIMRLMKLVASLNDGHTSIARSWDEKADFKKLPLRLYWFQEGIYISRIARDFEEYKGMKVEAIGGVPIEDVINKAKPYIHGDNESAVRNVLPRRLSQFNFLKGLGLLNRDELVIFNLLNHDGKAHTLTLDASVIGRETELISARTAKAPPLYLSNFEDPYWFTFMAAEKLMYFQFNSVSEMKDKPLSVFVDELFGAIDSLPVEKLVIDIRNNNGGDNSILNPLIHALIKCDKINQKGKLFTVIGKLTFSAAVSLTTELEKHTNTIFVGEPTSASPNHYGETKLGELPTTGIKFLYSSQFWQGSIPWDDRPWIAPSLPAVESIDDYINGRDPCLEAIMELQGEEMDEY